MRFHRMSTMPDNNQQIDDLIRLALFEDIRSGDITTNAIYSGNEIASARFIAKDDGVVAGIDIAIRVAKMVDKNLQITWDESRWPTSQSLTTSEVLTDSDAQNQPAHKNTAGSQTTSVRGNEYPQWQYPDGHRFKRGEVIAKIHGPANSLLTAERTMLNFMQRMSGIATRVREYVEKVSHTDTIILDTRKTLPGHRITDKMAVLIGGGQNHRFGLYDRYLIKENHIAVAGGIEHAIMACAHHRDKHNSTHEIEIEVNTLNQLQEVLKFPDVTYVMLDNMDIETMHKAVLINRDYFENDEQSINPDPHTSSAFNSQTPGILSNKNLSGQSETIDPISNQGHKVTSHRKKLEASGNIGLHNVAAVAETGVNYISIGSITHSVNALDISLLFDQ